jgi:hypothetical protein
MALLWLLSVKWADIGWQLPTATTPEELKRALEPLRGRPYENLVHRFLHPTPVASSAEEIRALRKNRGKRLKICEIVRGNMINAPVTLAAQNWR